VRIFRTVTPAKRGHLSNQHAAILKSSGDKWLKNEVAQQGIGGDKHMGARHYHVHQQAGEAPEERANLFLVLIRQDRESRHRLTLRAIV